MRKLDELKKSPVGKATGIVATKEGIGAIGGGAIGAALGGSLGVAGKIVGIGVALNGGIVLAGIGAVVGFLGVKAFKKNKTDSFETPARSRWPLDLTAPFMKGPGLKLL